MNPAVQAIKAALYEWWDWELAEMGEPIENGNDEWPGAEAVAELALKALDNAGYRVLDIETYHRLLDNRNALLATRFADLVEDPT